MTPEDDDTPEAGYAWGPARIERDVPPDERRAHDSLLEDLEEDDLAGFDDRDAGDYVLWALAQAWEEAGDRDAALAVLRRLDGSSTRHPALDYPVIALRLADHLKERGDYAEALALLARIADEDTDLAADCRERRAEALVLSGRIEEGLRLFEAAAREFPGDPWAPLAAAWALLQRGRHADVAAWLARAERALRDLDDEVEARDAAAEADRIRGEAAARRTRREAAKDGDGGLAARRDAILGALDREEERLVAQPPRRPEDREGAATRLFELQARASRGWDDAVEADDAAMIAAFDDLQWEVRGVAERFGLTLPDEPGDEDGP